VPLTPAEKQAAYRARKAEEAGRHLAESEQAIRDRFGYSLSESRSKAERDAAAARMVARMGRPSLDRRRFPVQTPGDLRPSPAALRRLGGSWSGG
jgi:hypothetical protein